MNTIDTEMHMRIIDGRGDAITVGPDKDGLGLVEVDGGENFGRLIVTPAMAQALAPALTRVADELREAEQ